jgi:hypothetical protein
VYIEQADEKERVIMFVEELLWVIVEGKELREQQEKCSS